MLANSEAVRRLKFAAERGNSDAQVDLGFLYLLGSHDLPQDRREAGQAFQESVASGERKGVGPSRQQRPEQPNRQMALNVDLVPVALLQRRSESPALLKLMIGEQSWACLVFLLAGINITQQETQS
jgi:hypothetical protein